MKKICFHPFLMLFGICMLISGRPLTAQQLHCPSPFLVQGGTVAAFNPNWSSNLSTGTKYIPTVVHLIDDAYDMLPDHVSTAIAQLNADFVDPSGEHTVVFVLATIDPKGQCTDGTTRHPSILSNDSFYKSKTGWLNDKYLASITFDTLPRLALPLQRKHRQRQI